MANVERAKLDFSHGIKGFAVYPADWTASMFTVRVLWKSF